MLDMMRGSKPGGGAGAGAGTDSVQIVFVISDARIQQDRERVARWSREAVAKRQLICLIVVDSSNPAQSVLSLKSVTYPNGKIKVVEYLESFPFPYYVVLRDIKLLPETVGDALRQWFEMIARFV